MARILIIDDDEHIRILLREILQRSGYEVSLAANGKQGLRMFYEKPADLVITDMAMPQMTGDKLAEEILKIRPDIPIILCTGYSDKIDENKSKDIGIRAYVMKPMILRDIAGTIREVLDKRD